METKSIQVFNNTEFGEIRSMTIDGEPYFVGKDVAAALGYERPDNAIRKHVDDEDKLTHQKEVNTWQMNPCTSS